MAGGPKSRSQTPAALLAGLPGAGDDDHLPSAPPAFPQPDSSAPRHDAVRQFPPAPEAVIAVAAARRQQQQQYQQQQQQHRTAHAPEAHTGAVLSDRAAYASSLLVAAQQQQQVGNDWLAGGAAAAASVAGPNNGLRPANSLGAASTGSASLNGTLPRGVPYHAVFFPNSTDSNAAAGDDDDDDDNDGTGSAVSGGYDRSGFGGRGRRRAGAHRDAHAPLLMGASCDYFGEDMLFANRQVRHAFIRRVLALQVLQLLAMAVAAAPLLSHAQLRHELRARPWLLALATGSALAALCGMTWAEATRRCPVRGLLMLAGFSAVAGVATGVSGAVVGSHAPMLALLLTAAAALALVCYAGQTSVDFSPPGATIVAAAALFGCVSAADSRLGFSTRQLLEGGCAALVMSAWIIVDVSAAAAGEGWHSLAPHEVIFAACNVYTDLITCVRWLLLRLATALRGGHEREWCMV